MFGLVFCNLFLSENLDATKVQSACKIERPEDKKIEKLSAIFISKKYKTRQGRTVRAQIKTNGRVVGAQVKFLSKTYSCHSHPTKKLVYECYIPIECEGNVGRHRIAGRVKERGGKFFYCKSYVEIKRVKFAFQQSLQNASTRLKRKIASEGKGGKKRGFLHSAAFKKYLDRSPRKPMWRGEFMLPTKVLRYSTPFGEIRDNPHWGRYLHKAVDIVGPKRNRVWASQNGKVVMKGRYKFSGKTVVLDHGVGVFTHYFHFDSFGRIKVGDYVKKGTMLGRIGNTGYSTGPHLHWAISIGQSAVDPVEWTTKMFA